MPFGPRSVRISFEGDSITHFGGVLLLQRFFQRLGFRSLFARHVRLRQRNNRYAVSESLLALLYPVIIGLGGTVKLTGTMRDDPSMSDSSDFSAAARHVVPHKEGAGSQHTVVSRP